MAVTRSEGHRQACRAPSGRPRPGFPGPAGAGPAIAPQHLAGTGLDHPQADAHRRFAIQAVLVLPLLDAAGHHIVELLLPGPVHGPGQALVVVEQGLFALPRRTGVDLGLQAAAAQHAEQNLLTALAGLGCLGIIDQRQHAPARTLGQLGAALPGEAAAPGHQQGDHCQTHATNGLHKVYSSLNSMISVRNARCS
ncbi:hypothetical protein PBOI14_38230 [Pseudomonas sp. Boi14]|nr:hypothetical protein PBOI14_38230 [Pseudomonas sp. Boi14]